LASSLTCFLIPSAAGTNIGTALCGADSVGVPVVANAGPRLLQHLVWPILASYGIWYARDKIVKAGGGVEMPKTLAT